MGGMKVSNMDFIKLLPAFMQDDEAAIALSKAVNKLIGEPGKRLATIRTWDKVDELTEAECNEMAWELDIDWYDSEGMSLTEKRNTIKLAQQIKRTSHRKTDRSRSTKFNLCPKCSVFIHLYFSILKFCRQQITSPTRKRKCIVLLIV